jgi:hypothetical protein
MKFLRQQFTKFALLTALCFSPATTYAQFTGIPSFTFTADSLLQTWNDVFGAYPSIYTRAMTAAEAQQTLSLWNRALQSGNYGDYEALGRELQRLGLIRDFGAFVGGASSNQVAGTSNAQVVNNTIQTSIFEKTSPAMSTAAKKSGEKGPITTVFGADAFYSRTEFDGGATVKGYGTNLSLAFGDRFQFRGTVPLYKTEFGGTDATTYGLDLNGKYRVSDGFAVGAHANYITNDSDFGDDKSWTGGVYAAALARAGESSTFSFGLLFDRVKPDGQDETWLGAAGINWGVRLGRATALNPYAIYYHTFDAPTGSDKDWYDLGTELQFNFSETWAFKTGVKTTLGQRGVKSSYQVYLGSAWRF